MRKLLLTILGLTLSLVAFAKTEAQLVEEYDALRKTTTDYQTLLQYALDNKDDVLKAFNIWKKSEFASMSAVLITKSKSYTKEVKNYQETFRGLCAKLYDVYGNEMDASDAVLCQLKTCKLHLFKSQEWYENIKSAGFIVNGVKLQPCDILILAYQFKDPESILKINVNDVMDTTGEVCRRWYTETVIKSLINMKPTEAKAKCTELENWFILNSLYDDATFLKLQSISKILSSRIIDEKIKGE